MNWIVGLDLRPSSQGAIKLGAWLCEHTTNDDHIVGVHVLEEGPLQRLLESRDDLELERLARAKADEILAAVGATDRVEELSIVRAASAEDALVEATDTKHARALVIGRHAAHPERAIVQLGRVARRLSRTLPVPLIITPPDLDAAKLGGGPILVATQLGDDSAGAVRFARGLATHLGRDLAVAHVVPMTEDLGMYGPAGAGQTVLDQFQVEGERDLATWMREQDLAGNPGVVAVGHVAERLAGIAEAEDALMIVCGSRRLGALERLFRSSIGVTLAATAHVPVALVPPDAG